MKAGGFWGNQVEIRKVLGKSIPETRKVLGKVRRENRRALGIETRKVLGEPAKSGRFWANPYLKPGRFWGRLKPTSYSYIAETRKPLPGIPLTSTGTKTKVSTRGRKRP
jgi:hypothetical protein